MSNPVQPWTHDRPARNLNPGDLRPRVHAPAWPNQSGVDNRPGGPFAIFPTAQDGFAALGLWLLYAYSHMGLKTARQMIEVFAPPSENSTQTYIAAVEAKVGTGGNDPHDVAMRKLLCQAIAHCEDARVLWKESQINAGISLSSLRWAAFSAALGSPPAPTPPPPPPASTADTLNADELARIRGEGTPS